MRMKNAFTKRRSALNFLEDFTMNQTDFDMIFELARYSPSVYNTQGTRYLVTTDKVKQAHLKEICFGQHKILTASGIILVLSDKNFLTPENIEKINGPMLQLGIMDKDEYAMLQTLVKDFRERFGEDEVEKEAYRNTYINVGMLMSIIAVLGFDSCPMHVHNIEQVRQLFNVPQDMDIMFMLAVGKATEAKRERGYRYQVGELVKYESYK